MLLVKVFEQVGSIAAALGVVIPNFHARFQHGGHQFAAARVVQQHASPLKVVSGIGQEDNSLGDAAPQDFPGDVQMSVVNGVEAASEQGLANHLKYLASFFASFESGYFAFRRSYSTAAWSFSFCL